MSAGEKIKKYLKIKDMSQTELSVLTKISLPKLNLMLSGKRKMQIAEYEIICFILNVPVGTFLEAKKPAPKKIHI